jgi:hypothetical protein
VNRLSGTHVVVAGLIACLVAIGASAQEKLSARITPQPGQSVRLAMTQEMDFDISFSGPAPAGVPGLSMQMRLTMTLTQKTGPRKADGTVDAELTYDELRAEMSMNGQTMPSGATDQLAGKTVTVTYGRDGQIAGVKGLPPGGLSDEAFKQMMGSMLGNLPATPLAVGETATVPLDVALPLPIPGAGPMTMSGDTRITLTSIDKDAKGRSARFDSTVDGKMAGDMASPGGAGTMTLDFTVRGDGTVVIDLDTGLPRSSLSTTTLNGTMGSADAALPAMTMRGTITVTMTGK